MDLHAVVGWVAAVVALVTVAWPLNLPIMAVAYWVRRAGQPMDLEPRELWLRSALASFGLAVLGAVVLIAARMLIVAGGFPAGGTLLVLLLVQVTAAVGILHWSFGMDEFVDAAGLFVVYVLLPGLPLLVVGGLAGLWRLLARLAPWLLSFPS